jgi:hypothetical protein
MEREVVEKEQWSSVADPLGKILEDRCIRICHPNWDVSGDMSPPQSRSHSHKAHFVVVIAFGAKGPARVASFQSPETENNSGDT